MQSTKTYAMMATAGHPKAEAWDYVEAKNAKEARAEIKRMWEGHWLMNHYWFVREVESR